MAYAYDYDFIGFSFGNKHSINDFGVYRTSDGSRYNDNLVSQINDKTADVPGGDGQYYFQTNYKNRTFSIPIAFDHITDKQYRELRQWLNGEEIKELIFDEAPYKVYSAKVTGTPQLKTICFSENGQRIYKGEGTIQFTCYWPYAHTRETVGMTTNNLSDLTPTKTVPCGLVMCNGEQITNLCSYDLRLEYTFVDENGSIDTDSVVIYRETSTYEQTAVCDKQWWYIDEITIISASGGLLKISIDDITYVYSKDANCFCKYSATTQEISGKDINGYTLDKYPTKKDWFVTANLPTKEKNINNGDIPTTFILSAKEAKPGKYTVGPLSIIIDKLYYELTWDSKTGLVKAKEELSEKSTKIIPITGTSYGTIPVGEFNYSFPQGTSNVNLKYNFWYY